MFLTESAQEALKNAQNICVLTGAGVSAESGIPTFRGEDGLWKKFRPEELANIQAFMKNPELVWEWYQFRRNIINEVEYNPGHVALAQWENLHEHFTLVTQNVDGLHRRAGNRNIVELHGNIMRNRCLKCGNVFETEEVYFKGKVPLCTCGGMLRPDVVWFGEMLQPEVINKAFTASEEADIFLSIGTSAIVYPAASLPEIAKSNGAFLIEINLEPTPLTPKADLFLEGLSGKILPELLKHWQDERTA